MKTIKQNDDVSCVAAVAAMITNTTMKEFEDWIEEKPPYSDIDLHRYVLKKGYVLGYGAEVSKKLNAESNLYINFSIRDNPAYVVVKSERFPGIMHAVYWDGKVVRDPNPEAADERSIDEFDVIIWSPVTKASGGNLP